MKSTRADSKKIYFLTGHGEHDLDATGEVGLKSLRDLLEESAFAVSKLSLLEGQKIPEDAAAIAIIGPRNQIFPAEVTLLTEFMQKGGHLLVAVDPGVKHDINQLIQLFGVKFHDTYVLNDMIQLQGRGMAGALGLVFSPEHEITKAFRTGDDFALFDLAGEVSASEGPEGLVVTDLVKTPPNSFSVTDPAKFNRSEVERRLHTLGIAARGRVGKEERAEEFNLVVFSDSDFMTARLIEEGLNRDLVLNTFAFLAAEQDLISIRPKEPKGTKLYLTSAKNGAVVAAGVLIPLVLLSLSGVLWFRRRGA